jgi:hypothetical protein
LRAELVVLEVLLADATGAGALRARRAERSVLIVEFHADAL